MIYYRRANENDVDELSNIVSESFSEYPVFVLTLKDKCKSLKEYIESTTLIHKMHLRISIKKHLCMVGIQDSKICSVVVLENPDPPKIGIFDYLGAGGWQLLVKMGLGRLSGLLELNKITEALRKEISQQHPDAWYVGLLSVSKDYQGQRLGSRMIEECIVPIVKQFGGKKITLVTNTEINRKFYIQNGFLELFSESIISDRHLLPNWGYLRSLESV